MRHFLDWRTGTSVLGGLIKNVVKNLIQRARIVGTLIEIRVARSAPSKIIPSGWVGIIARNGIHKDVSAISIIRVPPQFRLTRIGTIEDADGIHATATVLYLVRLSHRGIGNVRGEGVASCRDTVGEEDDDLLRIFTVGVGAKLVVGIRHTRAGVSGTVCLKTIDRVLKSIDIGTLTHGKVIFD
nr:hypothetical protein [Bifidobacterium sp. UBA4282]